MSELKHFSVMLNECISGLNLKDNGIYFDGTLGGGGHSYQILNNSSPNGKLIATDLDDYALNRANERLCEFNGRYDLIKDKNAIVNSVMNGVEGQDHAVILMHDASAKTSTVAALPEIVDGLRKKGFILEPITEETPLVQFNKVK